MLFIGLDPGVSGGLALIDSDGEIIEARKMPETERDILDTLAEWSSIERGENVRAMLEHVWGSPGWSPSASFVFGKNFGALRTALVSQRIAFDLVVPRKWQAALGCASGKDKNITKRRAQDLFPNSETRITHAIADALLLAEYCRRFHVGIVHPSAKGSKNGKEETGPEETNEGPRVERSSHHRQSQSRPAHGRGPSRDGGLRDRVARTSRAKVRRDS